MAARRLPLALKYHPPPRTGFDVEWTKCSYLVNEEQCPNYDYSYLKKAMMPLKGPYEKPTVWYTPNE